MTTNIDKSVLESVSEKATFFAEMYEQTTKSGNTGKADYFQAYLQGMDYVLQKLGYLLQYKDNTHVYIDTIDNVYPN